ncbi:hypothetical protein GW17_00010381 [Ensete ventricosum]|nr:hypothetical protein GW17_00010381 [Ensete ventricosum]
MASNLLKLLPSQTDLGASPPLHHPNVHLQHASSLFSKRLHPSASLVSSSVGRIICSASSTRDVSSPMPYKSPSSREEAISQAKLCLSTALQKPLNNSPPLPTRKLKKLRHPRYRVEIPVVDDSPGSLIQLALDVFSDLSIRKKVGKPRLLILWPSPAVADSARQAFDSVDSVVNSDCVSVTSESLSSMDLAVFLAPEVSQLEEMKAVADCLYPKPVVLFNPKWGFDEENDFGRAAESFVSSFEVVYSFMGLEVRGVLSKKRGVVLKCVRDGVVSGEGWVVMVEEEGNKEELKMVTTFKRRPSIAEVENVLYNLMAANSPVTKSVKFISDLVSTVTKRKAKK